MTLADFYEALTGQVDHQPWRERAACKGMSAELFVTERGDNGREAKAVCARCPVCADCLDYALVHHERVGIWGMTSERERKVMRRNMPRPQAQHGTVSRYSHGCGAGEHGGPCQPCKTAYADYRRVRRVRVSA